MVRPTNRGSCRRRIRQAAMKAYVSPILLLLLLLSSNPAEAFSSITKQQSRIIKNSRMVSSPASSKRSQQQKRFQTSLKMSNPLTIAAVSGAISGGLFAGSLHAVAGPDHLAALLPRCCGQHWYRAGSVGLVWGLGHGVSAVTIGIVAFFTKQRAAKSLLAVNSITELAVGISLIVIGLLGIKEANEWDETTEMAKSLSAAATNETSPPVRQRAILFNGLLHGFSWDGAPSLAPALAVANWSGNLAFLGAYATGTMVTMAAVTMLIGEGTRRAGRLFPNIPRRLSFASSIVAMTVGIVWCYLGIRAA